MHTGDDARRALDVGADGVVVSNHGGRQLDGVPASLRMLPEVLDAVDGRIEVLMDGGIRRGSDIVKALCLGARAVLIGRAYAYGLAAGGHAGVARAIDILRTDMIRTMKLLGCAERRAAGAGVHRVAVGQLPRRLPASSQDCDAPADSTRAQRKTDN